MLIFIGVKIQCEEQKIFFIYWILCSHILQIYLFNFNKNINECPKVSDKCI